VEDGSTGVLPTPLDGIAFAEAVDRLRRDVPLRKEMAARAAARVREHFTVSILVDKTLDIYEALWNRSGVR
jgi:glycosyltransferase involved in cell wall biosynthesis